VTTSVRTRRITTTTTTTTTTAAAAATTTPPPPLSLSPSLPLPPPPSPLPPRAGDGMLEYGEMKDYFAVCGSVLNDDEFNMVLSDMRDTATTAQMIKTATSMAAGA
jgi:hypothetical protein